MRCERAQTLLNALADDELGRTEAWGVRRHLRRCAACREEYAAVRHIGEMARTWRPSTPSPGLRERIASELAYAPRPDSAVTPTPKRKKDSNMNPYAPVLRPVYAVPQLAWKFGIATLALASVTGWSLLLWNGPFAVTRQAWSVYESNSGNIRNASFEDETNGKPDAWTSPEGKHTFRADQDVKHGGRYSARLTSADGAKPDDWINFGQWADAAPFRGKKVQLVGWLRTADLKQGRAGFWLRADSEKEEGIAFDNMNDRPIRGTTGWTRYEIILNIPKEANRIALGVVMRGQGTVWCDDMSLEALTNAGDSRPQTTTQDRESISNSPNPRNLNFDRWRQAGVPAYWSWSESDGTRWQTDQRVKRNGPASARVDGLTRQAEGGLAQTISARKYAGKRTRLSGWIRTQNLSGVATLWMRADGPQNPRQYYTASNTRLTGTKDWTYVEHTIDVPEDATNLAFGLSADGKGTTWADDLRLETVSRPSAKK